MPTNETRTRNRRSKILDAALDVFAVRGYHEAAVDEIALRARTSKGGLYFHFPGKNAIFLALLDRSTHILLARVSEKVEAEADPVDRLDAALRAVVTAFSGHRSLARLLLIEAAGAGPEFHDKLWEIHETFSAFIALQLEAAIAEGAIDSVDVHLTARAWFGALNEVITHWVLDERAEALELTYPSIRSLLLRSVGLQLDGAP